MNFLKKIKAKPEPDKYDSRLINCKLKEQIMYLINNNPNTIIYDSYKILTYKDMLFIYDSLDSDTYCMFKSDIKNNKASLLSQIEDVKINFQERLFAKGYEFDYLYFSLFYTENKVEEDFINNLTSELEEIITKDIEEKYNNGLIVKSPRVGFLKETEKSKEKIAKNILTNSNLLLGNKNLFQNHFLKIEKYKNNIHFSLPREQNSILHITFNDEEVLEVHTIMSIDQLEKFKNEISEILYKKINKKEYTDNYLDNYFGW